MPGTQLYSYQFFYFAPVTDLPSGSWVPSLPGVESDTCTNTVLWTRHRVSAFFYHIHYFFFWKEFYSCCRSLTLCQRRSPYLWRVHSCLALMPGTQLYSYRILKFVLPVLQICSVPETCMSINFLYVLLVLQICPAAPESLPSVVFLSAFKICFVRVTDLPGCSWVPSFSCILIGF